MSYYFAIVGSQDNPLFEYEFGTSKQGGDGQSKFTDQVRHLNQIILHSSLDVAEEVQWSNGQMYVLLHCVTSQVTAPLAALRLPLLFGQVSRTNSIADTGTSNASTSFSTITSPVSLQAPASNSFYYINPSFHHLRVRHEHQQPSVRTQQAPRPRKPSNCSSQRYTRIGLRQL